MTFPFSRIHWQDNEETKYHIRKRNEEGETEKIGELEFKLSGIIEEKDKRYIDIRSITQLFKINFKEESLLKIDASTFKPVFYEAFLSVPHGDINVKGMYSRKNVRILCSSLQGKKNHKIHISEEIYDNSEIIHMFRTFNYKELKKKYFKIFNILTGQEVSASVETVGEERVKVPAGEFECYRIGLELHNLPHAMKQYFLFSKCKYKYFVKNISGAQVIELISHSH